MNEERKKALQSLKTSKGQIEGIIKNLQHKTKAIAEVMLACRDDGMQSAEQADSASQLLQQITGDIRRIMDMTTQIAAATEEQSAVAEEISRNITSIAHLADQSSEQAQQTTGLSQELTRTASTQYSLVERFNR